MNNIFSESPHQLNLPSEYDQPAPFEISNSQPQNSISSLFSPICTVPFYGHIPASSAFNMWMSGIAHQTISKQNPGYSLHTRPSTTFDMPFFIPSTIFSIIQLDNTISMDNFVHTSEIEAMIPDLFSLYQAVPLSSTKNHSLSKADASYGSHEEKLLHILLCRYIYYELMCKNKIIYASKKQLEIFLHDGKEFILIHHPRLSSSFLTEPATLLHFYNEKCSILSSIWITNIDIIAWNPTLTRAGFNFLPNPDTYHPISHFNTSNGFDIARLHIPFSLLYLDCISTQSNHLLYSFIYHHLYSHNTFSPYSNPSSPIIVILHNSTYLDRCVITEQLILDLFDRYLSLSPTILHQSILLPLSHLSNQRSIDPYYEFPTDFKYPIASSAISKLRFQLGSVVLKNSTLPLPDIFPNTTPPASLSEETEEMKELLDSLITTFNDALLSYITSHPSSFFPTTPKSLFHFPSLNDHHVSTQNQVAYQQSIQIQFPLFFQYKSFLPLFREKYTQLLHQLQWDRLIDERIEYIELHMPTYQIDISHFSTKSLRILDPNALQLPMIQFFNQTDISQRDFYLQMEYFITMNKQQICPLWYQNINSFSYISNTDFDTTSFNNTSSHINIFVPNQANCISPFLDQSSTTHFEQALSNPIHHITETGLNTLDNLEITSFNGLPQKYQFHYHGDNTSHIGQSFTTNVNYYISAINKDIQINITSPDLQHATLADRKQPVPTTLSRTEFSTISSTLPMNQIIAIDNHLNTSNISNIPNQSQQPQKQPRYLVSLTNRLELDRVPELTIHPTLYAGISILNRYDPQIDPILTKSSGALLKKLEPLRLQLSQACIHIPLFIITMLPHGFDITTNPLPNISEPPLFGWDFDFDANQYNHVKVSFDLDPNKNEDPLLKFQYEKAVQFHQNIITQRMHHIEKFLVGIDSDKTNNLIRGIDHDLQVQDTKPFAYKRFAQRTVYHIVVVEFSGYIAAVPLINQLALAHFFSLGIESKE